MVEPLLIRADASAEIGTGHVMRCLALAQAWQSKGGAVHFIGGVPRGLEKRLRDDGVTIWNLGPGTEKKEDALETARRAREVGASWVVVDGYHFDGLYQHWLRAEGIRVLFLDDYGHAERYEADLVLNQNIDAEATLYDDRSKETELLLGPRYALLRKEFWAWREPRRTPQPEANRVLVTLGGSDPENCTGMVVEALGILNREDLHCTVVIGGGNLDESPIAAAKQTDASVDFRVDVSNMASLMAEHDVAVSAAGSTCWELAFMGIPNVIIVLADNQRGIAEKLDEIGASRNLGWHEEVGQVDVASALDSILGDENKYLEMAESAMDVVDGWGAGRVACELAGQLFFRPVQEADCEVLWRWANDPEVRECSYDENPIPWEEHRDWFSRKLSDPSSKIFVAEDGEGPVGQVRFDVVGDVAVISVVVDPEKRGRGHGTDLLKRGTERYIQTAEVPRVDAYIKKGNEASIRAFEKAGYRFREETKVKGDLSYRFSRHSRTET